MDNSKHTVTISVTDYQQLIEDSNLLKHSQAHLALIKSNFVFTDYAIGITPKSMEMGYDIPNQRPTIKFIY